MQCVRMSVRHCLTHPVFVWPLPRSDSKYRMATAGGVLNKLKSGAGAGALIPRSLLSDAELLAVLTGTALPPPPPVSDKKNSELQSAVAGGAVPGSNQWLIPPLWSIVVSYATAEKCERWYISTKRGFDFDESDDEGSGPGTSLTLSAGGAGSSGGGVSETADDRPLTAHRADTRSDRTCHKCSTLICNRCQIRPNCNLCMERYVCSTACLPYERCAYCHSSVCVGCEEERKQRGMYRYRRIQSGAHEGEIECGVCILEVD